MAASFLRRSFIRCVHGVPDGGSRCSSLRHSGTIRMLSSGSGVEKGFNIASTGAEHVPCKSLVPVTAQSRLDKFKSLYTQVVDHDPGQGLLRPEGIAREQDPTDVFANNDTGLDYIQCYGFDYDYTLAEYTPALESKIYELGIEYLVQNLGYPPALLEREFDRDFVIRGLHFDQTTGFLLKLDQFGEFRSGTVMLGREQVPDDVVHETYKGRRIPKDYSTNKLKMLSDLFSLPEACLLADVVQHFRDLNAEFHPLYIYQDVLNTLNTLHRNGEIHQQVIDNPERFLVRNGSVKRYLTRLRDSGKSTFLLTNSPFGFIDAGMNYMLGSDWRNYFDIVIVSSGKPGWYGRKSRFRRVEESGKLSLSRVDELRKGEIYTQGSLSEFTRLTSFPGDSVLYFGDQIFADLVQPQRVGAWKTAAVVKELHREIEIQNLPHIRAYVARMVDIEQLIREGQRLNRDDVAGMLKTLKCERDQIRHILLTAYNKNFGSFIRTYNSRTMFFYNVARYADLYTSSVANMLKYPLDCTFYAKRSFYPHDSAFSASFL